MCHVILYFIVRVLLLQVIKLFSYLYLMCLYISLNQYIIHFPLWGHLYIYFCLMYVYFLLLLLFKIIPTFIHAFTLYVTFYYRLNLPLKIQNLPLYKMASESAMRSMVLTRVTISGQYIEISDIYLLANSAGTHWHSTDAVWCYAGVAPAQCHCSMFSRFTWDQSCIEFDDQELPQCSARFAFG